MIMSMVGHRWRMMLVALPRHHHRQPVHDRHHHPFVGTATTLRRVPPATLLIGHGSCEDRATVVSRLPRVGLVFRSARCWGVTFRPFEETHHMGFEGIRLADGRGRFMLVLVGLGVSVVTLHGDCVPHAWRDHVRQGSDCVSSVYFVTGDARHFVHHANSTTLGKFRSLPLVTQYPIHCNPVGNSRTHRNDKTHCTENRDANKTLFVFKLKTVDVARCCLKTVGWYHAIGAE